MIGKLLGAWLGEKVAGENEGAKGAVLGYGAAAIARRSVPALAALAMSSVTVGAAVGPAQANANPVKVSVNA